MSAKSASSSPVGSCSATTMRVSFGASSSRSQSPRLTKLVARRRRRRLDCGGAASPSDGACAAGGVGGGGGGSGSATTIVSSAALRAQVVGREVEHALVDRARLVRLVGARAARRRARDTPRSAARDRSCGTRTRRASGGAAPTSGSRRAISSASADARSRSPALGADHRCFELLNPPSRSPPRASLRRARGGASSSSGSRLDASRAESRPTARRRASSDAPPTASGRSTARRSSTRRVDRCLSRPGARRSDIGRRGGPGRSIELESVASARRGVDRAWRRRVAASARRGPSSRRVRRAASPRRRRSGA